jgi:hypothetical protein
MPESNRRTKHPIPETPIDEEEDARRVAILFDLTTRDGRKAVEVRVLSALSDGYYASPRATVYSCAYSTQKERILALQRARAFCDVRGRRVVHFGRAEGKVAAWQ